MDEIQFKSAYGASRNGANQMYYHSLVRSFQYSDGVRDCAGAGCYWLLDILATEMPLVFRDPRANPVECRSLFMAITVTVFRDGRRGALITGELRDDETIYRREIQMTDLPEGEWKFFVFDNNDGTYTCILPTEY